MNDDTKEYHRGMALWMWRTKCDIYSDNNEVLLLIQRVLSFKYEGIENIPYELSPGSIAFYAKSELVQSVFDKNKDFENDLLKYEEWCKQWGGYAKVYHGENVAICLLSILKN